MNSRILFFPSRIYPDVLLSRFAALSRRSFKSSQGALQRCSFLPAGSLYSRWCPPHSLPVFDTDPSWGIPGNSSVTLSRGRRVWLLEDSSPRSAHSSTGKQGRSNEDTRILISLHFIVSVDWTMRTREWWGFISRLSTRGWIIYGKTRNIHPLWPWISLSDEQAWKMSVLLNMYHRQASKSSTSHNLAWCQHLTNYKTKWFHWFITTSDQSEPQLISPSTASNWTKTVQIKYI